MDGHLSLFELITQHSYNDGVLLHTLLKTCTDNQAFLNKDSKTLQPVVATINSKLNSSATRHEGLLLLNTYLPQCSLDIFGENAVSWMQQCLKSKETGGSRDASISHQVLKVLLQLSEQLPELKRPVSALVVPKIIDSFGTNSPEENSLAALECLETLMFNYGPSCGQHKTVLEKCVLQFVDSRDTNVIERVARCVAFLPLLGGGGSLGSSHVVRWKQQEEAVCASLHQILDELFDNIQEIPNSYSSQTSAPVLSLPVIMDSVPLLRVHYLTTRFINVSKFLQAMLTSQFPVEKTVLPEVILGIVCRGLAVTSQTVGKSKSPDQLMIGAMLPQIHIELLRVLNSLFTCCGRNLLPYAPVFCKLVLQTLKWTSVEKWVYGLEKPYGQLRVAACHTLTLWLRTSNCSSCVELVSDQLVPFLLQDIRFEKEVVSLNVQNNKNMVPGKKHKHKTSQDTGNLKKHIPDRKANSKTCRAALQALQWMLYSAASFIKPTVHRLLQETTVELLFDIQRTSNVDDLPVPYYESSCRLELYRLLHTLVLEPHTTWPPPTQFALHMLSTGRSDSNLEVSSFCTASLTAVEKLLHPVCGTLQFPVSLEEMLDSVKNYKQEYHTRTEDYNNQKFISSVAMEQASVQDREISSEDLRSELMLAESNVPDIENDKFSKSEHNDTSGSEMLPRDFKESSSSVKKPRSPEDTETVIEKGNEPTMLVVDITESNDELQDQEMELISPVKNKNDNDNKDNEENCEKNASKNKNIKAEDKDVPVSPAQYKRKLRQTTRKIQDLVVSHELTKVVRKLPSHQKEQNTSIKPVTEDENSTNMEIILLTDNEDSDNDFALCVEKEENVQPNPKNIKLNSPGSTKKFQKLIDDIAEITELSELTSENNEPNRKKVKLDSLNTTKEPEKSSKDVLENSKVPGDIDDTVSKPSETDLSASTPLPPNKLDNVEPKSPKTDSSAETKARTTRKMNRDDTKELPVNGVAAEVKDVSEEEMLRSFIDVVVE